MAVFCIATRNAWTGRPAATLRRATAMHDIVFPNRAQPAARLAAFRFSGFTPLPFPFHAMEAIFGFFPRHGSNFPENFHAMEAGFAIFPHHGSKFSTPWEQALHAMARRFPAPPETSRSWKGL